MRLALLAILSVVLVSSAYAQNGRWETCVAGEGYACPQQTPAPLTTNQCESEAPGCPDEASWQAHLERMHRQSEGATAVAKMPAHIEPRSMALSNGVLYLGTSAGAIYTSRDAGLTWQGLTKFRNDYVIDRIVVDGDRIYVAAWTMGDQTQGSFFVSSDGGKNWKLTLTKSLRGIAVSGDTLIVGGLDGVYRSRDYGMTFEPISTEIKDVQSIAIDPQDPKYIFVGTWHLGWYTHNGGARWHQIAKGIINDSDFFSIVLDGNTIYIGACSGIYKGSDDGQQYRKEKTKKDARRTHVIRQVNGNLLYAGTTDGLWVTTDGGKDWKRRGNRNIVVNDMVATSASHLVIATSRFGVIWSDNGGKTFTESQF